MKYVLTFIKSYIFGFLLTYFAIDMWRLATGDLRPLRKKGILVEWLVHSKKELYGAYLASLPYLKLLVMGKWLHSMRKLNFSKSGSI